MVDITGKISSFRSAIAQAVVKVSKQETIDAIKNNQVPKGDVFSFARAAGLLGVKKTPELIPDCHPLPVEHTKIDYKIEDLSITITIEVGTVYKTGVEVEAMHGASIVALTMYDMLKPIDKAIEIQQIKLIKKKGGKSQYRSKPRKDFKAAVLITSDSVSAGKKEDTAGKAIMEKLEQYGVDVCDYVCVSDDKPDIKKAIEKLCEDGCDLIVSTGGTGLSPRDNTPDVVKEMIDREVSGIMEAARSYGLQRTPFAMLSRGIAGFKEDTLILTLPGSTRGAQESMDALFPYLFHVYRVLNIDYKH